MSDGDAIVDSYIHLLSAIVSQAQKDLTHPCMAEDRDSAEMFFEDGSYERIKDAVVVVVHEFKSQVHRHSLRVATPTDEENFGGE